MDHLFNSTPSRDSVIAANKRRLAEGGNLDNLASAARTAYPQYFGSNAEAATAITRKQPSSANPTAS